MEPRDKFGAPIYGWVFDKMKATGRRLEELGYRETSTPNLFCCQYTSIAFMADMRGTEHVPIWRDPRPVMYASNRSHTPEELADGAWQIELARLRAAGLVFRIDPRDPSE